MQKIIIKNINHNNFKNVTIIIPKNKFIVITGPSGSGKSTLAIDIIYAEGQRKFISSLPSYARQFIPLPEQPNIDSTEGLTPCILIDQKTTMNNSRSTVGTISKIYDYVRTLYASFGEQYCINCNKKIEFLNPFEIANQILQNNSHIEILIKLEIKFEEIKKFILNGYTRYYLNNNIVDIRNEKDILLNIKNKKIGIEVILYHLNNNHQIDILEQAIVKYFEYKKIIEIYINNIKHEYTYQKYCIKCKQDEIFYPHINQKLFSFNLPTGACYLCKGAGYLPNYNHIDLDQLEYNEIKKLSKKCTKCFGSRLNQIALSVYINDINIHDFCLIPIDELNIFLEKMKNQYTFHTIILEKILYEIKNRIDLLIDLGLGYLTLDRNSESLSGGELQRIRLAEQLGSGLTGVTYILDEPSIGLHQSDNTKLISIIKKLRDIGNTIIVIEHDDETILAADEIIDIGPGAGVHGGKIVFQGSSIELLKNTSSNTALYLNKKKTLIRLKKKSDLSIWFEVINAKKYNLKNISFKIPLNFGIMIVVSGLSGSGKSTLVFDELLPRLNYFIEANKTAYYSQKNLLFSKNFAFEKELKYVNSDMEYKISNKDLSSEILFHNIIIIDQKPLSRTLRSTIGTYFSFFDDIRMLFASLQDSKIAGFTKGSFSFNTSKHRCPNCAGKGILIINMDPLPETEIDCEICNGNRYSKNILDIKYNNKNIFEVLKMNIEEAVSFFKNHKKIKIKLDALMDVGLGYLTLNQSTDTFSGGESQRIKLAKQLIARNKKSIYILDEPTTGLHFQDIALLLKVFDKLMEKGNILIIIEHNLHIIRYGDYIIDMGPGGGKNGGEIIATGTVQEIKDNIASITGRYI